MKNNEVRKPSHRSISVLSFLITVSVAGLQTRCADGGGGTGTGNPAVSEDNSSSGAAAGAIGGALSGSNSSGTLAINEFQIKSTFWTRADFTLLHDAFAANFCPSYSTSQGSGCSSSASTMWLSYSNCTFGGAENTWNGTEALILSSGLASCGTFPGPGANGGLSRQYVSAVNSTVASTIQITSSFGTATTVDDATDNLGNFNGDTIPGFINGKYGSTVDFTAGLRTSAHVSHRLVTPSADRSINGTVNLIESGLGSRTITGTLSVYHNILHIVATSEFQNVTHKDSCCFPVSGSVFTTFSAGSNSSTPPTSPGGVAYVGKSETLTFTGCGTASFQAYDGSTSNVALTHCF